MSERFLKFIPSDEAMWLLKNKGHAFRLLAIIAESARRYEGDPDGLKIGECYIGGHENYDMSERNYRTAKDILVKRRHVEIVETCRTRKKSTTGTTTVGTKVKLLSSNVWNINLNERDDRNDDCPTTARRPSDDKQERIRKKKKEEEKIELPQTPSSLPPASKIKFREFVHLTQTQYDSLLSQHGQVFLDRMLDTLDSFKGSTGKKYDSDFHTMKEGGWVIDRVKKDSQKASNEKSFKHATGSVGKPSEPTTAAAAKFQSSRVIRGSNSDTAIVPVEGDQWAVHE